LSGEYIGAQEAQAIGLVDHIVLEGDFDRVVKELTQNYLKIASEGQRQTKHLLDLAFDLNWNDFLKNTWSARRRRWLPASIARR